MAVEVHRNVVLDDAAVERDENHPQARSLGHIDIAAEAVLRLVVLVLHHEKLRGSPFCKLYPGIFRGVELVGGYGVGADYDSSRRVAAEAEGLFKGEVSHQVGIAYSDDLQALVHPFAILEVKDERSLASADAAVDDVLLAIVRQQHPAAELILLQVGNIYELLRIHLPIR